jgi:hypothetical protein
VGSECQIHSTRACKFPASVVVVLRSRAMNPKRLNAAFEAFTLLDLTECR